MSLVVEPNINSNKKVLLVDPEPIILQESIIEFINDHNKICWLKENLDNGKLVIFKKFTPINEINSLKAYLINIMRSSLPEFVPITQGAKNNFRINMEDERAQVKAFFYVWSFYTWNQDFFSLYNKFYPIYNLRNLLSNLPAKTFLSRTTEIGCAARLSIQFYPAGKGYFSEHIDPYDKHQLVVPIMSMSKYGSCFKKGGNYVITTKGTKLLTEEITEPGDIVLFNSLCRHGVEAIDPDSEFNPLSDVGRWMMLFAVNKVAGNTDIADAYAVNNVKI